MLYSVDISATALWTAQRMYDVVPKNDVLSQGIKSAHIEDLQGEKKKKFLKCYKRFKENRNPFRLPNF